MKRIQKDILFVLISSFVLTVAWIGFNIHHKWVTSTISEDLQVQIQPIVPDFDSKTLEKLKARKQVTPNFDTSPQATESVTPTIAPQPSSDTFSQEQPLQEQNVSPNQSPDTFNQEQPLQEQNVSFDESGDTGSQEQPVGSDQ